MSNTDFLDSVKSYNKIYRWLGLCIDYYAESSEEDDQEIAKAMRKDPTEFLEALVQIRMALITYKMANVTHEKNGSHLVNRIDLERMLKDFPPTSKNKWWKEWLRYIKIMDDVEWTNMWIALDSTIEDRLTQRNTNAYQPPSIH